MSHALFMLHELGHVMIKTFNADGQRRSQNVAVNLSLVILGGVQWPNEE